MTQLSIEDIKRALSLDAPAPIGCVLVRSEELCNIKRNYLGALTIKADGEYLCGYKLVVFEGPLA